MKKNDLSELVKLSELELQEIDGGRNGFKENLAGLASAGLTGAEAGSLFGPWGTAIGAGYTVVGWTAVTAATGGF